MRQRQPVRQEADVAEVADDTVQENAGPPRRADKWSPADAYGCGGRSAPNSPPPPPAAVLSTTARRPGQAARQPWGPLWPKQSRPSARYRLSATSARGRTSARSCCDRPWRGRREPVLRRHTPPDSGRGRPTQRRCGCRHRTPRARSRWPHPPAAWCRSGGCNGSSSPRSRRAPNAPARTLRSDRDRPACRARSAGSSFPTACRARRTRTRSGGHGRGR